MEIFSMVPLEKASQNIFCNPLVSCRILPIFFPGALLIIAYNVVKTMPCLPPIREWFIPPIHGDLGGWFMALF